jgi:hypothetical protein
MGEKGQPQILSLKMRGFDEDELKGEIMMEKSSSDDRDSPDSTPRYKRSRDIMNSHACILWEKESGQNKLDRESQDDKIIIYGSESTIEQCMYNVYVGYVVFVLLILEGEILLDCVVYIVNCSPLFTSTDLLSPPTHSPPLFYGRSAD